MNPVTWQKTFPSDLLAMSLPWKQQQPLCINLNLVILRAGIAAFGSVIYVREITRSLRTGLHCAQSCIYLGVFSPNSVAFRLFGCVNVTAELGFMQESWFGNGHLSRWCWGDTAPVCTPGWCRLYANNLVIVFNLIVLCCEWDCFEHLSQKNRAFSLCREGS